ncbi:NhaP-type Na+/H+ or K+/H+ antiporter [Spinactinospora alkalitolerans]|uniref:NhaP-type Na+/H+ or K+/H+ antiporter n=1 Tax=Spinactinospora alkalitolerans TaxID=687207 RepID=A0A852TYR1_9ACTN|nr:cation:proton antiporter [Spinactinospora alkalitolerans]NYE48142.1 NhaP-type Na+/H+ or K+/H+ antiporter [Spinactinospora alkalitolerans]
MAVVLAFAVVLFAAVLVSEIAHRTVLSTAVLFLVAGFVLGDGVLGFIPLSQGTETVRQLAEFALFAVLFTDGMRLNFKQLRTQWRLPGRALGIGMPITFALIALLAHYLVGLNWLEAFLIAAVLSPTDPVFAAALVSREKVPQRVRHLLNVESGLNDGLALPVVLVLLALAANESPHPAALAGELALGIAVGVGLSYLAIVVQRLPLLSATARYGPLGAFAIGLAVLGLCSLTHANMFLGAFTAGVTIATASEETKAAFDHFGELVAELLKLAALLVFGAVMSPAFLADIPLSGWVFAVLVLVLARPVALLTALVGSDLGRDERLAVAWFGPKGFASVVYGLLVLHSGLAASNEVFHLVALAIAISILAHSSTDILIVRRFESAAGSGGSGGSAAGAGGGSSAADPSRPDAFGRDGEQR